jgi:hypothetical protein
MNLLIDSYDDHSMYSFKFSTIDDTIEAKTNYIVFIASAQMTYSIGLLTKSYRPSPSMVGNDRTIDSDGVMINTDSNDVQASIQTGDYWDNIGYDGLSFDFGWSKIPSVLLTIGDFIWLDLNSSKIYFCVTSISIDHNIHFRWITRCWRAWN